MRERIKTKGWLIKDVAARWEITTRRLQQLLSEGSQRTIDGVNGLPDKSKCYCNYAHHDCDACIGCPGMEN